MQDGEKPDARWCRIVPISGVKSDPCALLEIRTATSPAIPGDCPRETTAPRRPAPAAGRQRRTFYSVLDEFPALVYIQRRDYTVAYANKKVHDLYGETESRLCYEVFSGRQTPCPVCPTFEVFETGRSIEWEFTDEQDRTFRIYDYPFENEDGEPLVMELGIDVTDLKRVENELFQAQKLRAIESAEKCSALVIHGLQPGHPPRLLLRVPIRYLIDFIFQDQDAIPVIIKLRDGLSAVDLVEQFDLGSC